MLEEGRNNSTDEEKDLEKNPENLLSVPHNVAV
jgi:hypothetical protein